MPATIRSNDLLPLLELILYRYSLVPVLASVLVSMVCGCRPQKPIEVSEDEKPPQMMVAGMMIRDDKAWSVKAKGSRARLINVEKSIYEFAASWDFKNDPNFPKWKLPEHWVDMAEKNSFRVATFEIRDPDFADADSKDSEDEKDKNDSDNVKSDSPVEVIVSVLPFDKKQENRRDEFMAENINRWRKQMGVNPVINYAFNEDAEARQLPVAPLILPFTKKVTIGLHTMYFDRIEGTSSPSSRPPFAGKMGKMPPNDATHGQTSNQPNAGQNDPGPSSKPPFEFTKPEGWKPLQRNSVAFLRYQIGDQADTIVSVSSFPRSAVDWEGTVTMWQGQLKVEKTTGEDLAKITSALKTGPFQASMIELESKEVTGPQDPNQPKSKPTRLIGIMIPVETKNYFVKLQGDPATVVAEKQNLIDFVESMDFSAKPDGPAGNESRKGDMPSGSTDDKNGKTTGDSKEVTPKSSDDSPKNDPVTKDSDSKKTAKKKSAEKKTDDKESPKKVTGENTPDKKAESPSNTESEKSKNDAPLKKPAEKDPAKKAAVKKKPAEKDSAKEGPTEKAPDSKSVDENSKTEASQSKK